MKEILEIPEGIIDELSLNGEAFFSLKDDEIDEFEISDEQKTEFKNYLKSRASEEETIITDESTKEEVKKFLYIFH